MLLHNIGCRFSVWIHYSFQYLHLWFILFWLKSNLSLTGEALKLLTVKVYRRVHFSFQCFPPNSLDQHSVWQSSQGCAGETKIIDQSSKIFMFGHSNPTHQLKALHVSLSLATVYCLILNLCPKSVNAFILKSSWLPINLLVNGSSLSVILAHLVFLASTGNLMPWEVQCPSVSSY